MSSINDVKEVAKLTNRSFELLKSFESKQVFVAIHQAEDFVKEQGYKIGSMCRDMPMACAKNKEYIAKWRNIDEEEYKDIEVMIVSEDMRNGPVVEVYKLV